MDRPVILADLWTLSASEQIRAAAVMIGEDEPGPVLIGMSPLLRSVVEHSTATCGYLTKKYQEKSGLPERLSTFCAD
jgi:hypothetical protein